MRALKVLASGRRAARGDNGVGQPLVCLAQVRTQADGAHVALLGGEELGGGTRAHCDFWDC